MLLACRLPGTPQSFGTLLTTSKPPAVPAEAPGRSAGLPPDVRVARQRDGGKRQCAAGFVLDASLVMATTSCRQLTARPGHWCRCHLFLAGNRRATRGFRRLAHAHQPLFKLCPGAAPRSERAEDLLQHCQLLIERG